MHRIVVVTILGALCAIAQPSLQLKSKVAGIRQGGKRRTPNRVHRVAPLEDLDTLAAQGGRVVQYVPDNALLMSMPESADAGFSLSAEEKWSPELVEVEEGIFLVEFYPDVEGADARAIVGEEGLLIGEHADLLDNHLLVEGSSEAARRLTEWDEVAYVFPASEDLAMGKPVQACVGALTAQGTVGQYIAKVGEGWDGPGKGAAALAYLINNVTAKLPPDAGRAEIEKALDEWTKYVQVNFIKGGQAGNSRHLNILFAAGAHGDAYPFDGPGKVLAHTFYPAPPNPEPIAGDMHLDGDENWRIGNDVDLFSVALHELGHALGLGHADKPGAVMYAYYSRVTTLTVDDIAAIRELYASRDSGNPGAPTPPSGNPNPPPPTPPAPPTPTPPPTGPDRTPPSISIVSPASTIYATTADRITLRGSASDNIGVAAVIWISSTGKLGIATGTTSWSATDVPLLKGNNYLIVRAYDAAGNNAWRSIVVTRR